MNALLKEIPAHERIITIEDTRELRLPAPNNVTLIASKGDQGLAKVPRNSCSRLQFACDPTVCSWANCAALKPSRSSRRSTPAIRVRSPPFMPIPPGPGGDMQPVLQIDEKKSGDPPELGQGVS
ncbi:hypothetical protein X741_33560 [Mesorhizobium sp. LNHC229A00]|nr:hypothetical protein X741_33560 [Mesorhizobium sp. LNHC229A00]